MSKYQRKLRAEMIDVYDVLEAFKVTNPATAHAVKKLLCPGQRGVKSIQQDLSEAITAIERAIDIEKERGTPPAPGMPHQMPVSGAIPGTPIGGK